MNELTQYRNGNGVAPRAANATPAIILEVIGILSASVGLRVSKDDERAYSEILSGFDDDVLRYAAREYGLQRGKAPENVGQVGQFCGWLQRAIEAARPKYSARMRRAEPDTFVAQFVAACGNDTRAFIAAQANAPHTVVDVDDEDRADLLRRIELTRTRIANGGFVDAQYGLDYLAHLEAQL